MTCIDCGSRCHGRRCLPCQRDFERENDRRRRDRGRDDDWYQCCICPAKYRGKQAAMMCCGGVGA